MVFGRTPRHSAFSESEPVSVTVEPREGYSDAEVVAELRHIGAEGIRILGRGFVTARASRSSLTTLKDIARVHVDTPAQPA